jgi:hypothetical protein
MRIYVHQEAQHEAEAVDVPEATPLSVALGIDGDGDVAVLLEDADEELDITLSVVEAGVADRAHVFRGRRRRIIVVVSYNGERREHEFGPNARVHRVFRWATGEHGFSLGKEDAAEHTLVLVGTDVIPPGDAHLGSLDDTHPGHLAFALIPKHRFEG